MFKNPFSFDGRIGRTEYCLSILIRIAAVILIFRTNMHSHHRSGMLLLLPLMWFAWAQAAKRCHDLNNSGWWQMIPFYFFWLMFEQGNQCPNQYDMGYEAYYGGIYYKRSSPEGDNSGGGTNTEA